MTEKKPDLNELSDERAQYQAVIVVTMNIASGAMTIQGNALGDRNLAMRILIEAAHQVLNQDAREQRSS